MKGAYSLMPNYYNAYPNGWQFGAYPNYYAGGLQSQPMNSFAPQQNTQYMINVDGEMAARAWQMPTNLAPNTIIPLWDFDGQHVYFKSVDAYGRMNPLRKGRIVFDDEPANLPQGEQQSGAAQPVATDMSRFVTKDDLASLKQEIRSMMQSNQNGSNNRKDANNRG